MFVDSYVRLNGVHEESNDCTLVLTLLVHCIAFKTCSVHGFLFGLHPECTLFRFITVFCAPGKNSLHTE